MENYKELIKTNWIEQYKPSLQQLIKRAVNKDIDFTDLLDKPHEEFEKALNERIIKHAGRNIIERFTESNRK